MKISIIVWLLTQATKDVLATPLLQAVGSGTEFLHTESEPIGLPTFRDPTDENTKNAIIASINCYRACHSAQPLVRDKSIETGQTNGWAEHLSGLNGLEHSQTGRYGENLYAGPNPIEAVKSWQSECSNYPYGAATGPGNCGHFTQDLWKDSERIGVAIATMEQYGYVVVANFYPPGNFYGDYADNVGPLTSNSCESNCANGGAGNNNVTTITSGDLSGPEDVGGMEGEDDGMGSNNNGMGSNDNNGSQWGNWGSNNNGTNNGNNSGMGSNNNGNGGGGSWGNWGSGSNNGGSNNGNGGSNSNNGGSNGNWGNNNGGGGSSNCGFNSNNCSG